MKSGLAAVLFVVAMLATQASAAQDAAAGVTDMQALRAAVKADRRAFVAATLSLSDAEAKKFWPLYDTYHRALDVANRQRALVFEEVLGRGTPPSDLHAKNLASELIAADEAEVKARRKLQSAVMRALPARKAARYLQLEAKIRAYQAYDIAATFPLIK